MQILFVDESGTPPPPTKTTTRYFIAGGVILAEDQWHHIEYDLNYLKSQYKIEGEVKWRYFGQARGREVEKNNLKHLDLHSRDKLRTEILGIIQKYQSIKLIVTVTSIASAYEKAYVKSQQDLYWYTYKPLTERFQYYLQDLSRNVGSKINGIIVCDHRGHNDDEHMRRLHANLLNKGSSTKSKYENLIEGLFIVPSHLSIGIQLADIAVGAVYRKFEHNDD
jgi:hypothetical protein